MIFVTGDTHGEHDIHKLNTIGFPEQKGLTRDDYVIICGDFGVVWNDDACDRYWLEWLENKPWTTLWIDGNHENFDLLRKYPKEQWNSGVVQKITPHVIHLCRGEIFNLQGKTFFAMGGAESTDRVFRKEGLSWWKEEMPSDEEMAHAIQTLEQANWNVDYVLTHTICNDVLKQLFFLYAEFGWQYKTNQLSDFFQKIEQKLSYQQWFCGHYHDDIVMSDNKHTMVYHNIIRLPE